MNMNMNLTTIVCAVLALSGCGGGGGSDTPSQAGTETRLSESLTTADAAAQTMSCDVVPPLPLLSSNVINVTDYGAIPDDDEDDTGPIQAALNTARNGQWVVFPAGRYIHNRSLQVNRAGVTLWGQGATLHAISPTDQSVMLKASNTRIFGFTLTAVTEGRGTKPEHARIAAYGSDTPDGFISGVVIQGNSVVPAVANAGSNLSNSATAAGILLVSTRDFLVAHNRVERSLADGIHVTGRSRNGRILENVVRETGDDTIAVVSYLDKNWRTNLSNSPDWFSLSGFRSKVTDILIARNDVSGQYWGRGIAVIGGERVTIKSNTISRSAMGAGILVARERPYESHGINNVLVEDNDVSLVQTNPPEYMPIGSFYNDLYAKTSTNGGRTGQAGIEVHNTSSSADINSDLLRPVVMLENVLVRNNRVSNVWRDAIRIGADSQVGSILGIELISNFTNFAGNNPVSSSFQGGAVVPIYCAENTYNGGPVSISACEAASVKVGVNWGASISCY